MSAEDIAIGSTIDVFTLDVSDIDVAGTVDLGQTLVVLGEDAITISAADIFGDLTAPNAESATIIATGVIGLEDLGLDIDNPFVANLSGPLNFDATGGVIDGDFGGGDVFGFAFLDDLEGTNFVINGVTVVFANPAPGGAEIDIGEVIDSIAVDPIIPEAEVDLGSPIALQSTSIFVADVFVVDFSLGTDLTVAPAAGGYNFLGNFWDNLIETEPEEDTADSSDEVDDDSAGDDLFADDEDIFNDDVDLLDEDDEEDEEAFIGDDGEEEDVFNDQRELISIQRRQFRHLKRRACTASRPGIA